MRILLVNPTIRPHVKPFVFPIGLGVVAAMLQRAGHEVVVIDQNGLRIDDDEVIARARRSGPFDLVATGGLVTTYRRLKELIPRLKKAFPEVPLVLGGGVTVEPDLVFAHMPIDIAVVGEAEHTVVELAAILEQGGDPQGVPGTVVRTMDDLVAGPVRPPVRDLDALPWPAYDLFPTENYFSNNILKAFFNLGTDATRIASLAWSRGCPNECTFCWRMTGRTVRFRSLDLLLEEIVWLRERYGVDGYLFVDECINASPRLARELAQKLIDRHLTAPWYSHARVTNFTPELANLLAASGCVALNFGVESGAQEILIEMKKHATPEHAALAVATAKAAGILPNCTFIIGMPSESEQTVRASVEWIIANKVQNAGFFFATPYPGTELYNQQRTQQRISERYGDRDNFFSALGDAHDFMINLTDFSDEKLLELHAWASRQTAAGKAGYTPPAAAFQPEKIFQPIIDHAAREGRRRLALYGGGAHTQRVLRRVDFSKVELVAVIDDEPDRHGQTLSGVPILSLDDALACQIDAVVLSSDRYEPALHEKCRHLPAQGVEVIRPYHALLTGETSL